MFRTLRAGIASRSRLALVRRRMDTLTPHLRYVVLSECACFAGLEKLRSVKVAEEFDQLRDDTGPTRLMTSSKTRATCAKPFRGERGIHRLRTQPVFYEQQIGLRNGISRGPFFLNTLATIDPKARFYTSASAHAAARVRLVL